VKKGKYTKKSIYLSSHQCTTRNISFQYQSKHLNCNFLLLTSINLEEISSMTISNQNQHSLDETNGSTLWDFLRFLITNKQGQRVITGMAAILAIAVLGTIYFMRPEEIEISTGSGTISIKRGNTQNALFLLSPNGGDENTPWVGTGIEVKKGDVIKITASGRVNTSIKRVVAETIRPEVDERTWVGPSGLDRSDNKTYFSSLDQFKTLPDKNGAYYGFGMLLAGVRDSKGQIKTGNIVPFVKNREFIEFTAENDGELVLTVNDIWLSGNRKYAYIPPISNKDNFQHYLQLAEFEAAFKGEDFKSWSEETKRKKAEEQYQRRLKGWDSIINKSNWNIWYDDNIGSFSVSIAVNEKD
jgi:hypothetical protein